MNTHEFNVDKVLVAFWKRGLKTKEKGRLGGSVG